MGEKGEVEMPKNEEFEKWLGKQELPYPRREQFARQAFQAGMVVAVNTLSDTLQEMVDEFKTIAEEEG